MQVQVHYQGMEHTPWTDEFIMKRLGKLDRYLNKASHVQVNVKFANRGYVTTLSIHNPYHDYAFSSDGVNLFESFSTAMDKAMRSLGEQKRRLKDKINKQFYSLKRVA